MKSSADAMAAKAAVKRWFVYIIECRGGLLYTGITTDVVARFDKHDAGRGAAFTRINKPLRILASMPCADQAEAARAEFRVRNLPRSEKLVWAQRWQYGEPARYVSLC